MAQNNNDRNNKPPQQCQEHFKLFSYLAMAILTIAIIVGMFIILQHMSEEEAAQKTIANQETLLENQRLLLLLVENQTDAQQTAETILNESRRDSAAFFDILANMTVIQTSEFDNMTKLQTEEFNEVMSQAMNISIANNKELDKILKQGVKLDAATNKKIDRIIKMLKTLDLPLEAEGIGNNMTVTG